MHDLCSRYDNIRIRNSEIITSKNIGVKIFLIVDWLMFEGESTVENGNVSNMSNDYSMRMCDTLFLISLREWNMVFRLDKLRIHSLVKR